MADTVANLVAIISADTTGAINGLNKVGSGLSGLSDQFLKTGALLTGAVTVPIIGFLGTTVKAASDLQNQLAQTNAVIKSTGGVAGETADSVLKLATALSDTTRYSKDQVISAENLLLTFRSIGKGVFPDATKAVLDMSQALGQDTKSSAIQLGKALEDPVRGITALRRVGIQFTAAQEDTIKALVKSGNLLGAQKLILKEVQTEFGGSAVAAGQTFAGQMDILNHKFTDFQEKVGNILIPFLEKLLNVGTAVVDWLNTLNPGVLQAGLVFLGLLAAIGPVVTIIGAVGAAIAFLATPLGAIVVAITAIGIAWSTNFLGMRDRVNELGITLRNAMVTFQQIAVIVSVQVTRAFINLMILIGQVKQQVDALVKSLLGISSGGAKTATTSGIGGGQTLQLGGASGTGGILGKLLGFASGGYTGNGPTNAIAGVTHGQEYVVPHNGALVMSSGGGYNGPAVLQVNLQAQGFEDHIYLNVADAIRAGSNAR